MTHSLSDIAPAFCAELCHANVLISLLRAIHVRERPKCIVTATSEGLKCTCENSRVMQGSVILPKSLFRFYDLRQEDIAVTVNLEQLLKCIGSFSEADLIASINQFQSPPGQYSATNESEASLKLTIQNQDSDLEFEVAESEVTTTTSMGNEETSFQLFPNVPEEEVTSRLTLPTIVFGGEMWWDFDPFSEDFGIRVDGNKWRFFFSSPGGRSEVIVGKPNDCNVTYEYKSTAHHHTYVFRHALVKETLNALVLSRFTILSTSETNTSIKYKIMVDEENASAYIEYLITAKYMDEEAYPEQDLLADDQDNLPLGAEFSTIAALNQTSGEEQMTSCDADNDVFDDDGEDLEF